MVGPRHSLPSIYELQCGIRAILTTQLMTYFSPAPNPPTALGRYRLLSPHASIRVSPIQLGAMSIGTEWGDGMGEMTKESSFKLLDAYYDAGGNFIDTANG